LSWLRNAIDDHPIPRAMGSVNRIGHYSLVFMLELLDDVVFGGQLNLAFGH
jgi:hypothetical protein